MPYEEGLTARENYDEARAAFENASAQLRAQQERVRKKKIRAPFTGVLGLRQMDLGEYLEPGAHIVSLRTLDPIYVDYSLPQRHFHELSENQRVEVHPAARPERVFEGRVIAFEPGISVATRSFSVRGMLENPTRYLRPGMFVEISSFAGRCLPAW